MKKKKNEMSLADAGWSFS